MDLCFVEMEKKQAGFQDFLQKYEEENSDDVLSDMRTAICIDPCAHKCGG